MQIFLKIRLSEWWKCLFRDLDLMHVLERMLLHPSRCLVPIAHTHLEKTEYTPDLRRSCIRIMSIPTSERLKWLKGVLDQVLDPVLGILTRFHLSINTYDELSRQTMHVPETCSCFCHIAFF